MGNDNGNGNVFTLQKSLLCDCPGEGDDGSQIPVPALTIDGQGIVLNLNGYTVACKPPAPLDNGRIVIKVLGTANKVVGPGTGECVQYEKMFSILMTVLHICF